MTPILKDILSFLEEIAPSELAEDWDNPGLQVGRSDQEIKKILIALDPLLPALHEAEKQDAQLLLTHHPLIFSPLSSITPDKYPGDLIFQAIENKIAIASLHTNLDMAKYGINDMLTTLFDLEKVEILQEKLIQGQENRGLGCVGELKEPSTLRDMVNNCKKILGTKSVGVLGTPDKIIKRLAIVGGSGGSMIPAAVDKQADLLISGDIGHHDGLTAGQLGIAVIDAGHFHTEKKAMALFSERLSDLFMDKGWNLEVLFHNREKNPIRHE